MDLNDATAEPAVFAFILFCRDAVDIWLAALRLADELLHGLCQICVLAAYERPLHACVRLGQLVGIDGETRFVKADAPQSKPILLRQSAATAVNKKIPSRK